MSVKVENILKRYGQQVAVNNVSFEANNGEIIGLIGPNGAGKTTLMRMICGLLVADAGKIWINGLEVNENPVIIKRHIGYLPENNPLYYDMYIPEYLNFTLGIYEKKNKKKEKIDNIIEMTGLNPEKKKKIGQLSKGYRQRVGLARALIHDPEILILDEPTTGLDPNQIIEIRNLISSVGKEKTVILSTHLMQEVEAICHRVLLINRGVMVADENPENLKNSLNSDSQVIVVEFDKKINEQLLLSIDGVEKVKKISDFNWIVEGTTKEDIRPKIFNIAVNNNFTVLSMQKKNNKLEEVFYELTIGKNSQSS